jgi:hypothetical protein
MKVLLSQLTSAGPLSVGRSSEGRFHVIWCGDSVAVTDTLDNALKTACGLSWRTPSRGEAIRSVHVSTSAADWVLVH